MKKRLLFFLIISFIIFGSFSLQAQAQSQLAMAIRNHLIVIEEYEGNFPQDTQINFYPELINFYDQRHYQPLWLDQKKFKLDPKNLIKAIKNSYEEGLNPADYHLKYIKENTFDQNLFSAESRDQRALFEIILTDAYLNLASDYLNGKTDPKIILKEDSYQDDNLEAEKLLKLLASEQSLIKTLQAQLPTSKNYHKLKEKLYLYRDSGKIKPWPQIYLEENLLLGAEGKAVEKLVENLAARNYLDKNKLQRSDYFSQQLKKAVLRFQLNHGLNADGIVGSKTIEVLNIPLARRIKQLIINLERWRWLPENLGSRYIYVNIADYKLKLYNKSQLIMEMKTIVGREQRSTPVFSEKIDYLVLNPYWYVPRTIAVEDILPQAKKDYSYFSENNFTIFEYTAQGRLKEIEPSQIEWEKIDKDNFNFLIRQNPGDNNSLGRVKFMFPNRFSVYLHDTPGKYLFSQNERSFSSGCIRIEKPVDLAAYLLKDQSKWSREKIISEMKKDQEKIIYLTEPIKIYLQYNTAWVDPFARLQFREDIYGRDQKIIKQYFKGAKIN